MAPLTALGFLPPVLGSKPADLMGFPTRSSLWYTGNGQKQRKYPGSVGFLGKNDARRQWRTAYAVSKGSVAECHKLGHTAMTTREMHTIRKWLILNKKIS